MPNAASKDTGAKIRPRKMTESAPAPTRMRKHSLVIAGHSTSVSLEDAFWLAIKDIAARQGVALAALVAQIDATRGQSNLSSAIRVFVLKEAQSRLDQ